MMKMKVERNVKCFENIPSKQNYLSILYHISLYIYFLSDRNLVIITIDDQSHLLPYVKQFTLHFLQCRIGQISA